MTAAILSKKARLTLKGRAFSFCARAQKQLSSGLHFAGVDSDLLKGV